ncbi:MAG: hypothetical protein MR844_01625 [Clostridia bacterium]|nr:hypothetical protein [Clostridia bacterium]
MKKIFIVSLLVFLLTLVGCKNKPTVESVEESNSFIEEISSEKSSIDSVHNNLIEQTPLFSEASDYSVMFSYYKTTVEHSREHNCNILSLNYFKQILQYMLYGTWKDEKGNIFSYTYVCNNYYNTHASTWLQTNLPSSQKADNTYHYYIGYRKEKIVIGYEDQITETKTDNYVISYDKSSILVENLNNNTFYNLTLDTTVEKIQRGNAKLAYIYIAKNIYKFKNPGSVKVSQCYVEYSTKKVYVTIQAMNSFGGVIKTKYVLWKNDTTDSYYIIEDQHSYNYSNVDLNELNNKLENYLKSN